MLSSNTSDDLIYLMIVIYPFDCEETYNISSYTSIYVKYDYYYVKHARTNSIHMLYTDMCFTPARKCTKCVLRVCTMY